MAVLNDAWNKTGKKRCCKTLALAHALGVTRKGARWMRLWDGSFVKIGPECRMFLFSNKNHSKMHNVYIYVYIYRQVLDIIYIIYTYLVYHFTFFFTKIQRGVLAQVCWDDPTRQREDSQVILIWGCRVFSLYLKFGSSIVLKHMGEMFSWDAAIPQKLNIHLVQHWSHSPSLPLRGKRCCANARNAWHAWHAWHAGNAWNAWNAWCSCTIILTHQTSGEARMSGVMMMMFDVWCLMFKDHDHDGDLWCHV